MIKTNLKNYHSTNNKKGKMICALLIGKHNSSSIPGKNYMDILNRPLVEYPLLAATNCKLIDKIFVSTDSPNICKIASKYNVEIIDRPSELAKSETPTEITFAHGYNIIKEKIKNIKYLILMFANSVDVLPKNLEKGIDILNNDYSLDSVVSVSEFTMFSPLRARKLNKDNTTEPVLDLKNLGLPNPHERRAMGDIYFIDFGTMIVRPDRCLEKPLEGALPFRWLGQKQGTIINEFGFDIDAPWQIAAMKYWLEKNGFTSTSSPYC